MSTGQGKTPRDPGRIAEVALEEEGSVFGRFPGSFWAANTMEIFERMGWYGFYAVSSLYLTGAVEEGGLGLSSTDRGVIQGLVTFLLYLFPAVFGALADRYGYKAMFLASCVVMIPGYLLLQLPSDFWGFFACYTLVALGHGMFKPVVVSTIVRATTEKTGTLGFGIFYMMVNVGGFVGPIFAGVVRGWGWNYVFIASAAWIILLGLTCLVFYREPEGGEKSTKSLLEVGRGIMELIGNARFFILVAGLMIILVMGAKWLEPSEFLGAAAGWLALNLAYDLLLLATRGAAARRGAWIVQRMQVGETRYLIFLLLMAGFWTSFNQIFITLPEYIRDYVDTSDLIAALGGIGVDTAGQDNWLLVNGEIKPEYLINLNALGIIVGQILISYLARNLKPFTTIISGVAVTVLSFFVYLGGTSGWWIVVAILVFSVGEMLASPKSKEYAGRIAPPGKVGLYMGYFYWCVALGNLFGGLLSGVMYDAFGPQGRDQPNVMWVFFALLAVSTAVLLAIYDRWVRATKQTRED